MIVLGWVAVVFAAVPAVLFLRNIRLFCAPGGRDDSAPVSILIPARDEEANIAAAIDSALANANAEVLVLDDHSSDRTYDIAAEIAARQPRVRVLRGEPLLQGWLGKNFACAQLAAAASNPLLLFVDADVRLAPSATAELAHALRIKRCKLDQRGAASGSSHVLRAVADSAHPLCAARISSAQQDAPIDSSGLRDWVRSVDDG